MGLFGGAVKRAGMGLRNPYGISEDEEQQQTRPRKGLFGSGFADKLSGFGDDLAVAASIAAGDPGGASSLMRAREDSPAQRAMEAAMKRRQEIEDYVRRKEIDQRYQEPKVERTTDNAGNVFVRGPDGKWKLDFVDQASKTYFNNGMQVDIPNPYAGRAVGTTAPGYEAPQGQMDVNGEFMTPPKLGQDMPTLQEIQAERERRRRTRGY